MSGGARRTARSRGVLFWLRRLVLFVVAGALAAVLLVALLGLAYTVVTPVSTLMLGRWLTGQAVTRTAVPLEAIAPDLALAVVTSEDQRFCEHGGVDWDALRAVVESADDEDGPSRGASTLTMQLAKNLFLWPGRSVIRKGLEIPLAMYLDLVLSKRRQMEIYLNVAEWGPGTFGAEAGAQRAFNKPARALSRREAALLASALPNPILRNPGRPRPGHRGLADRLAARMPAASALAGCVRR